MSAGDIDDSEEPASTLYRLRAENREFDDYLRWAWQLKPIKLFFIPYAAGINEEGTMVYISHDITTYFEGIELENALVRHETTEWALRYYLGIGEEYSDDPIGHRISNNAEFDRVRALLDRPNAIDLYEEWIDPQIHTTERTDVKDKPIPRDLALYPYEDDIALLDELQEEMYNDRSMEEWGKIHPEDVEMPPKKEEPDARGKTKVDRSAFIYLDPKPPEDSFAQCGTCRDWVRTGLCVIHGPDVNVTAGMSCALYVNGDPSPGGTETYPFVTPTESGLVDREVRCENCRWGGDNCQLFTMLNKEMPDVFALETKISPKGCCNAQQPKTN